MAKSKHEIIDGKKKCNTCGLTKTVDNFYTYKKGIRGSCKVCLNQKTETYRKSISKERRSELWQRFWKNPENRQKKYKTARKRYKSIKKQCVDYLGGKCSICGYDKCIEALEFHHLDPNIKETSLNTRGIDRRKSFNSQKQELDKCVLLCANCHREQHYNE